jgi:hypothetical protein
LNVCACKVSILLFSSLIVGIRPVFLYNINFFKLPLGYEALCANLVNFVMVQQLLSVHVAVIKNVAGWAFKTCVSKLSLGNNRIHKVIFSYVEHTEQLELINWFELQYYL